MLFKTGFGFDINIISDKVFSNPSVGVVSVIEKIRLLQGSGKTHCRHNIIGESEIRKLCTSNELSKNHPKAKVTRVIFSIAITRVFIPTEIHSLKMNQVCFTENDGKEVL